MSLRLRQQGNAGGPGSPIAAGLVGSGELGEDEAGVTRLDLPVRRELKRLLVQTVDWQRNRGAIKFGSPNVWPQQRGRACQPQGDGAPSRHGGGSDVDDESRTSED